ncbi:hypothetical protein M885DRAFT_587790 [Pelagophyceae sp. CCMP2097]|nr:hypothetical protein M885DRAFT_587790 [Pelagophyceae sp. CCMP2097]|mmetsp:Transcript_3980/g.12268  ORF Transcript_3980/g.12268 Transcript_3980/m.12268 type:complete len:301 (+) Transcript_3980:106-1008(+)
MGLLVCAWLAAATLSPAAALLSPLRTTQTRCAPRRSVAVEEAPQPLAFAPLEFTAPLPVSVPAAPPKPKLRVAAPSSSKRLVFGLAFLTGLADIVLFRKYRTFSTMMTGNTMWMAAAVVNTQWRTAAYYLSIIFAYVGGLAAFRVLDTQVGEQGSATFAAAPAVALLFAASDLLSWKRPLDLCSPMLLLAAAFGIINSVGQDVAGLLTFVVTGHMTKLTAMAVDRLGGKGESSTMQAQDLAAAARSVGVIGAFFGGAMCGAVVLSRWPKLLDRGMATMIGMQFGALFLWQFSRGKQLTVA